jgi:hypothetical protein
VLLHRGLASGVEVSLTMLYLALVSGHRILESTTGTFLRIDNSSVTPAYDG